MNKAKQNDLAWMRGQLVLAWLGLAVVTAERAGDHLANWAAVTVFGINAGLNLLILVRGRGFTRHKDELESRDDT